MRRMTTVRDNEVSEGSLGISFCHLTADSQTPCTSRDWGYRVTGGSKGGNGGSEAVRRKCLSCQRIHPLHPTLLHSKLLKQFCGLIEMRDNQ
eukprot:746416-Hanusia_phi.AAC.1